MAQVSKYPIHKDVEIRMFEIFKSTISRLKSAEDVDNFLDDFLSPVEKIMLAKRLSIAVLLGKGYKYPTIANILRVTPSTIASVSLSLKYSGKGYKRAVEKILMDEKINNFWGKVEDVIANVPPSKGSSWVYHRKKYELKKNKNKRAF